jgi:hypothetical protein
MAYLTGFFLVVAIVHTKTLDATGFERVQHVKPCPKGTEWRQSAQACLPK